MGRSVGGVEGNDLVLAAEAAAAAAPLLVAVDVDGTLAPLAPRADLAALLPGVLEALVDLATAGASVAVVSGRGIDDLTRQFPWPPGLRLIGSHGLEDSARPSVVPTAEERQRLQAIDGLARKAARAVPGCWVEQKVAGVAFHYRQAASASQGSRAALGLGERLDRMEGVYLRRGHLVLEAAVRPASKADAVAGLRRESGAATVVYLGDDETDEEVFQRLTAPADVTVRVGLGETSARYRLTEPVEAVELLQRIARLIPAPGSETVSPSAR